VTFLRLVLVAFHPYLPVEGLQERYPQVVAFPVRVLPMEVRFLDF
jgi:hypothetical protein